MRRLFLALGAISLLACGGDSTGVEASSAVGTWNLFTVNGSPLPFTLFEFANPPFKSELMSEQLVVAEDGTYVDTFTIRENDDGTVTTTTDSDAGTWTQAGSNLTLVASDGSIANTTISGNTITLNAGQFVVVYSRQ